MSGDAESTAPTLALVETVALGLLVRRPWSYGIDLIAASSGRLRRGTVYVLLHQMEERGLVVSAEDPSEDGRLPRRRYAASKTGEAAYRAQG